MLTVQQLYDALEKIPNKKQPVRIGSLRDPIRIRTIHKGEKGITLIPDTDPDRN